jgi:spermidine synthase
VAPAVAPAPRATPRAESAAPPAEEASAAPGRAAAGVLALGFFASGLVSIGYELIWMRTAAFLLGGFTYVFAGVLTVYLLGNVVGAWAGSRLSARLRHPGVAFGVTLTVLGGLGLAYLPWFNVWFARGEAAVVGLLEGTLAAPSIRKASLPLVHSVALFLAPALVMGLGFPLALQAWSRFRRRVGLATGTVYGANTIGAVLGGLVTGFLLVPRLGVQWALAGLALVAVWLGWGLVTALAPRGRPVLRVAWSLVAVACTAGAVLAPGDLFRRNVADAGREVLSVIEGPTTTVAVTEKPDGRRIMAIDNVGMAGDDLHRSAQKTLGHLPVLLHRDPETVLLVGYGTGETAWCLAQHDLSHVDGVEVAREVVEAAHAHFGHINLGEDLDRHVRMHYMDARNYLNLTDKRYDVIINDSDVHATAASAPLYAREHFANALDHLEPGGRFITKLHLQGHPKSNFDSILATFTDAFPHTTVWFPATRPFILLYLVGSRETQRFSPPAIDAALAAGPVRRSLAYMHVRTSEDLLSWYVGDARDVAAYLDGAPVTTDDRPFLAYNLDPHRLSLHRDFRRIVADLRRGSLSRHLDWTGVPRAEREAWSTAFRDHDVATTHLLTAHGSPAFLTRLEHAYLGLTQVPDHAALRSIRRRALAHVRRALAEGRVPPERVLADMQRLRQAHPDMTSALLAAAWALEARGDRPAALEVARAAAREAPRWADTHAAVGSLLLAAGDLGPADAAFRRALSVDPDHAAAREGLDEVARRR